MARWQFWRLPFWYYCLYWSIVGLSLHLLPYFVYMNSEGSGHTLQMHWLVWSFAARRCKIKIQNHDTGFLTISIERYQTFSMKCYLLYARQRRVGLHTLNTFPQILYLHEPWFSLFASIILSILQNRHISEHNRARHDTTWRNTWSGSAMFAQSDKLHTSRKTKKMPDPMPFPVTNVKWFGSRSAPISRVWPGSNYLHVTSPHQWERISQGEWAWMYTCVKNNFHIKILRRNSGW